MIAAFDDARARVVAACAPLPSERVALAAACGRVPVATLLARDDLVPFARSAMDGFAVRAADTRDAPRTLPVRAMLFAERAEPVALAAGFAAGIATGAPLPAGADAVVPIEDVALRGDRIELARPFAPGDHVFAPGEDARRGDVLAPAGVALGVRALGLLAAGGHASVAVARRPRVAIVCGGEELVAIDREPGFGQIRNSNASAIAAFVASLGGEIVATVQPPDDPALVRAALRDALARADLTITTGGASAGERDYVKPLLRDLGATFAFDAVALRPGRPTAFATLGDARVLVLPGNPAAAFVGLVAFVGPALRALQGVAEPYPPRVVARLNGTLHGRDARTYAPFVRLAFADGTLRAAPLDNQCSALTRTAADGHALAIVPPGERHYVAGDRIACDVYDWSGVVEANAPAGGSPGARGYVAASGA